ncbi:MAG: GNAT family N-acetyltransferase [Patescibacteria group bacterium]
MAIDKTILNIDPSRYTVYQMLDYLKETRGIALRQEKSEKLYLFKTEPYIDSLYNYAHALSADLTAADIREIRNFFGADPFRISAPASDDLKIFLLAQGLKFRDSGYIMRADNFYIPAGLPEQPGNVTIRPVDTPQALADFKSVFALSFDRSPAETEQKFGFLDRTIIDAADSHIKTFVLSVGGVPAATGSYYAFDEFSVEGIGTKPEFRGRGYAQLIMARLAQAAIGLGYRSACLDASAAGAPVYQKFGFRVLAATDTFISQ